MTRLSICSYFAVALAAGAAGPPLADFCEPFRCDGCEVVWAVPTNRLPASISILKVVPTKYPANVISNLLDLAELTYKNRMRPVQTGVFLGKDVLSFGDREETRHLDVVPSEGCVVIVNSRPLAGPKEPSQGVPSTAQALKLTLKLLPVLGIPEAELATNRVGKIAPRSFSDETEMHKEKPSGKVVTNLLARSVQLNRQIEGVPVWGAAGIGAKFGNHGKLAELNVAWRKVEPFKRCAVPSARDFVELIKNGKSLMRSGEAGQFEKVTVTDALLYYWENSGSEAQKLIHPFAVLEAEALLDGKKSRIEIFVPFASR